ncbi:hypothetical protein J3A64_001786 [Pseudarthrobacter sp. PvP004]|nr:hypothetical protein [Pseudarthrobacter sp. PvP004]
MICTPEQNNASQQVGGLAGSTEAPNRNTSRNV